MPAPPLAGACEGRKYGVPNVPFIGFSSKNLQKLLRDEQFSDKRNAENGTLWTDTNKLL